MAKTKKYIEYTTSDILLRNKATGEEIFLDSLESDKLSKTVDTEDIKGGIKNQTFTSINKNEKITLEAVDVLSREELNIARWGSTLKTGDSIVMTEFPKPNSVIETAGKFGFTLAHAPINSEDVKIFDIKDDTELTSSEFTITGTKVEISKVGTTASSQFYTSSYDYLGATATEYYDVDGSSVPSIFEAIRIKPIYDLNDTIVYWRETHMPKVQLSTSIEEGGSTEKTKQTSTYTFSVLKDENSNYTMRTIHKKVTP